MRTIMLKGDGAVVGYVTVRVIEYGHGETFMVARSQAQRLLAQCGQGASVTLDFDGVDQIGQGFADLWRIGQLKDNGVIQMSWPEITELMNKEFHSETPYQESVFRKRYVEERDWYGEVFAEGFHDEYLTDLQAQQDELLKAKVQVQDQRREYRKMLV